MGKISSKSTFLWISLFSTRLSSFTHMSRGNPHVSFALLTYKNHALASLLLFLPQYASSQHRTFAKFIARSQRSVHCISTIIWRAVSHVNILKMYEHRKQFSLTIRHLPHPTLPPSTVIVVPRPSIKLSTNQQHRISQYATMFSALDHPSRIVDAFSQDPLLNCAFVVWLFCVLQAPTVLYFPAWLSGYSCSWKSAVCGVAAH